MCFDNVGIEESARHQGTKNKTVHIWTSAYATMDRVDGLLEIEKDSPCTPAHRIGIHNFLQSESDITSRRTRMVIIVQRILKSHLVYFESCSVEEHILHKYSDKMAMKSNCATIGIIQANPGSTEGNMAVLDALHKYVPFPDGHKKPPAGIPVHGDASSVLSMIKAKRTRSGMGNVEERLEGIWPVPGEFHRRMLQNQDTMNLLFNADSINDIGTLAEIKNRFQMKGVKKKVSESFNHVEDLLNLSTKGLVCLVAMKLLDISFDTKSTLTDEELQNQFADVAEKIVTFFWHQTPMTDVMNTIEIETPDGVEDLIQPVYCSCQKTIDGQNLVECANINCKFRWFHDSRIDETVGADEEWLCTTCKDQDGTQQCVCRKKTDENMIECSAKQNCPRGRYFHPSCVGYVAKLRGRFRGHKGRWFCSNKCRGTAKDKHDYVQQYTKALGFRGLLDMVARDAVREGDGEAINSEWRMSMADYANFNRNNYRKIVHMMLAFFSGLVSKRAAETMTWNRTINIHGGAGRNIPMDRYNEFINADIKRILKDSSGRYTKEHISRTGHLAGPWVTS